VLGASLTGIAGLSGCSKNVSQYGTFNVPINVTDGTTSKPVTLTVSVLGPNTD
jgi:hypothetical protein